MRELPRGTVTFLFTDIEASTLLLHEHGERYADVLGEHRRVLREAFGRHGGVEVDTQGDAFFVAFAAADDALAAAAYAQERLGAGPVRVRMGVHSGDPVVTDEGYVGVDVHRAARICGVAHGGQVVVSERTRELLDGSVPLRDLGLHRLKDLTQPEKLFQLGSGQFPPLRTLNATNLPSQPSPLIGRERELAEVTELLRREDVRIVTLTGTGGTGKTRLAVQAAAELVDEFKDGVFFVSLMPIDDPALVVPTIAQTLGLRESATQTFDDGLHDYLRERSPLLLVDNFEHVLDAAPALGSLLETGRGFKFLTTSREPLRLRGEREYEVSPLAEEGAFELFVERAQMAVAGFTPDGEALVVREICDRLDRLPLAVELAAARVKVLSPQAILDRLERRLPLLVGGARDAPERQRTLRATIEWSYDLLADDEKRLFERVAVFPGSFDLAAAEEICDAELDTLQALVDKSLLRRTPQHRFFLLETIREYALDTLEDAGGAAELRRRHAQYFLGLAERGERPLFNSGAQLEWMRRLESDQHNHRAAVLWALEHGEGELVLRASWTLALVAQTHGRGREARAWFEEALRQVTERSPARAKGLRSAATMAVWEGDPAAAVAQLEEDVSISRELADREGLVTALTQLAGTALAGGDVARARALADECADLTRDLGETFVSAGARATRAGVAMFEGDLPGATELLEEAAGVLRRVGEKWHRASWLSGLGPLLAMQGDDERAREVCEETVALAREFGGLVRAETEKTLAWVLLANPRDGDRERAAALFGEALAYLHESANNAEAASCLEGLACVDAHRDGERAARLLGAAERFRERAGYARDPFGQALHDRYAAVARDRIGDEAFEAAHGRGRELTLGEAVEEALADARP